MNCDRCSKKEPTKLVHIRTGKRGRPPKRNWCSSCITSFPNELVAHVEKTGKKIVEHVKTIPGFHASCLFLLEMGNFEVLFSHIKDEWIFHCKGCDEKVKRTERLDHFLTHKAALNAA